MVVRNMDKIISLMITADSDCYVAVLKVKIRLTAKELLHLLVTVSVTALIGKGYGKLIWEQYNMNVITNVSKGGATLLTMSIGRKIQTDTDRILRIWICR